MMSLSNKDFLVRMFESMTHGAVVIDTQRRLVAMNRAAAQVLHIQPDQGLGRTLEELGAYPVGGPERAGLYQALTTGERRLNASSAWHYRDRIIYVNASVSPILDDQNQIIGAVAIFEDITEKRISDEQLKHAERLASLGEFAAQIVHEIRNPLSTIYAAFDILEQDVEEENKETMAVLQAARQQVLELNELLGKMLDLSRQNSSWVKEPIDIGPLLQEVVLLIKPKARRANIVIQYDTPPMSLITYGVALELRQVFFNLMLNSVEAMGRGGHLRVKGQVRKDRVTVEISDTGPGIATKDLDRVAQPFYTTKDNGTGLGLTVVRRIVADHQGTLTVSSSGLGTMVVVDLPVDEQCERSRFTDDRVFEEDI